MKLCLLNSIHVDQIYIGEVEEEVMVQVKIQLMNHWEPFDVDNEFCFHSLHIRLCLNHAK